MFHDTRRESGKAVTPGKEGVPETFIVEPLLIHEQQRSQNTGLDHRRTLQIYLLQSSQFPPLRPVRNASARQPDQDPADSGHTSLATAQGSWRTGHEQQRDAVPAAGGKGKVNDTPLCTRRQSETGIATADRLTEGRGQREATPDHQSSTVSANYTNNSDSETNDPSVTDEQRGSASGLWL